MLQVPRRVAVLNPIKGAHIEQSNRRATVVQEATDKLVVSSFQLQESSGDGDIRGGSITSKSSISGMRLPWFLLLFMTSHS